MQALAASCEELRARTGNPPLDSSLLHAKFEARFKRGNLHVLNSNSAWAFPGMI